MQIMSKCQLFKPAQLGTLIHFTECPGIWYRLVSEGWGLKCCTWERRRAEYADPGNKTETVEIVRVMNTNEMYNI